MKKCRLLKETSNTHSLINHLKAMVTQYNSAVWPEPYVCAKPYHLGSAAIDNCFVLVRTHQHGTARRKGLTVCRFLPMISRSEGLGYITFILCGQTCTQSLLLSSLWFMGKIDEFVVHQGKDGRPKRLCAY